MPLIGFPNSLKSRLRGDDRRHARTTIRCGSGFLKRMSHLSARSQRQRVFSTPGLRRPLVAREVAIREAQSRDRATEAIVIGALEVEARLHHGAAQIRADLVATDT
jgi:hypothetical protein